MWIDRLRLMRDTAELQLLQKERILDIHERVAQRSLAQRVLDGIKQTIWTHERQLIDHAKQVRHTRERAYWIMRRKHCTVRLAAHARRILKIEWAPYHPINLDLPAYLATKGITSQD